VILAILLAALSFAHWFIANNVFHVPADELHSIMYLHISSAPHFVIFSTRVPGYWWENMPHWIFATCIIATQIVALFFSVYGIFGAQEHVAPCGWAWGIVVLAISLVYFMILDVVRCYFYLILEDKEDHTICLTYFLLFSPSLLLLLY
jgi:H+-transporting ATPase